MQDKSLCSVSAGSLRTLLLLRREPSLCNELCKSSADSSETANDGRYKYQCISASSRSISSELMRFAIDVNDLQRLNATLESTSVESHRSGPAAAGSLISSVASSFARGNYCLIEQQRITQATQTIKRDDAPAPSGDSQTPSQLRGPAPATPTPAAGGANDALPFDQDQQAQALRNAAESGVPFCEECNQGAVRELRS